MKGIWRRSARPSGGQLRNKSLGFVFNQFHHLLMEFHGRRKMSPCPCLIQAHNPRAEAMQQATAVFESRPVLGHRLEPPARRTVPVANVKRVAVGPVRWSNRAGLSAGR